MNIVFNIAISVLLFFQAEWGNNLEAALDKAKQNNELVMLNFCGTDWCAPCIMLKKQVLESVEFKNYAEGKLVLVRADFPRQKKNLLSVEQTAYNETLAEKYNPEGRFPLTLLLSADGTVLHTWDGYPKGFDTEAVRAVVETLK